MIARRYAVVFAWWALSLVLIAGPSCSAEKADSSDAEPRSEKQEHAARDSQIPAETARGEEPETAKNPATETLPRLVDLGAGKCIPCKMMAPILEELKRDYTGQFDVEFIDVWKDPEPGRTYRIRVIPTQLFFDAKGNELWRHEGFFGKDDILKKWEELGVTLRPPKG
jgi:thioredoxin 1